MFNARSELRENAVYESKKVKDPGKRIRTVSGLVVGFSINGSGEIFVIVLDDSLPDGELFLIFDKDNSNKILEKLGILKYYCSN